MSRCDYLFPVEQSSDISVRDEIIKIVKSYGRWGLFRRIRRTSNHQLLPCPQCRKIGTQDHSTVHVCDKCLGVGYIWDEEWIRYYQWPGVGASRSKAGNKDYLEWGALGTNSAVIYVEARIKPTHEDKIIEVAFDDNGIPLRPTIRTMMFDIRSIDDYRLDDGRLEYYRLVIMKQVMTHYGQPISLEEPGPRRLP